MVSLHHRARRIVGLFKTFLQQFANLRFNTCQSRKVFEVHLGNVISEVWKKDTSTATRVRSLKATGVFPLCINAVPDNYCSICGAAETGEKGNLPLQDHQIIINIILSLC